MSHELVEGKTFNWQLINSRFCYYLQSTYYWGVGICQHWDVWMPQQHTNKKEMICEYRGRELLLTDSVFILFPALSVLCQNLLFLVHAFLTRTLPELPSVNPFECCSFRFKASGTYNLPGTNSRSYGQPQHYYLWSKDQDLTPLFREASCKQDDNYENDGFCWHLKQLDNSWIMTLFNCI